jgi:hypothetical protein
MRFNNPPNEGELELTGETNKCEREYMIPFACAKDHKKNAICGRLIKGNVPDYSAFSDQLIAPCNIS